MKYKDCKKCRWFELEEKVRPICLVGYKPQAVPSTESVHETDYKRVCGSFKDGND